jgi:hypothetical protein
VCLGGLKVGVCAGWWDVEQLVESQKLQGRERFGFATQLDRVAVGFEGTLGLEIGHGYGFRYPRTRVRKGLGLAGRTLPSRISIRTLGMRMQ